MVDYAIPLLGHKSLKGMEWEIRSSNRYNEPLAAQSRQKDAFDDLRVWGSSQLDFARQ